MELNAGVEKLLKDMCFNAMRSSNEELNCNEEYKELSDKKSKLWNKITELIPYEVRQLLDELDCTNIAQSVIQQELIFNKGITESIELLKLMKVI